ncbi:MAG TPA: Na+/H+ antiporter [Polyangia bacterium]|nr:Na+/H+ antiporter [Polyangia bacterium]
MDVVTMVLGLLAAVVATKFAARLLPVRIPLQLLQIAVGAGLHWGGFQVEFDSHLFLLLFIPPLLFLDGWRIPKGAFFRDWKAILALAIGLVVFTVVGVGLFAHALIPAMPLTVAFALAAILSPTDPVAVGAMTARAPLPPRLTHILEGEALLNDATGLVCFTFAVQAAVTGQFSLPTAALRFVVVAGGGVLAGAAVAALIGLLNRLLLRRTGEEDPATQILISLLIPFAAYLAGEELRVSGILAAAVAGMVAHYTELARGGTAATRTQRAAVWNTVQAALTGIIFILLGEHLPSIVRGLPDAVAGAELDHTLLLIGTAAALTVAIAVLRFAWVWFWIRLTIVRHARADGRMGGSTLRLVAVAATAGVRGAVTLAGILTLPLVTASGAPFPAREAAISIAMGVILLSLLAASLVLPRLARGLESLSPPAGQTSEGAARIAAARAGLERLRELTAPASGDSATAAAHEAAVGRLIERYQHRIDSGGEGEDAMREADAARDLRLRALTAERDELYRLRRAGELDDDVHRRLVRELDLLETSLLSGG